MKKISKVLAILIFFILIFVKTDAEELIDKFDFEEINGVISSSSVGYDFNFEESVKSIMSGGSVDKQGFFEYLFFGILGEVKENLHIVIFLVTFSVFGGLISNFQSSFNRKGISDVVFLSVYFVFAYVLIKGFHVCYVLVKETMQLQFSFIKAATPIYVASVAATGHITIATTVNSMFLYLIQICSGIIENVLFPLTYWIFLLTVVNNSTNKVQITKIIQLAKQTVNWVLGFVMTIFVGILSLSGLKGATIDKLGVKAVKYAMGSFVPVVGRLLSDTIDTVISSATLVRNSLGIVSIFAIIIISLYPILKLVVIIWLYRLTAGIIEPISDKRLSNVVSGAASTIQTMMTMLLTVSMVMILSVGIIVSLCGLSN